MFDGAEARAVHVENSWLPEVLPDALHMVVVVLRLGLSAFDSGDSDLWNPNWEIAKSRKSIIELGVHDYSCGHFSTGEIDCSYCTRRGSHVHRGNPDDPPLTLFVVSYFLYGPAR